MADVKGLKRDFQVPGRDLSAFAGSIHGSTTSSPTLPRAAKHQLRSDKALYISNALRVLLSSDDVVRPHHVVVLVFEDVAVEHVTELFATHHGRARRQVEARDDPRHLAGERLHGVLGSRTLVRRRCNGRTREHESARKPRDVEGPAV